MLSATADVLNGMQKQKRDNMKKLMTILAMGIATMLVRAAQNTNETNNSVSATRATTNHEAVQAQHSDGLYLNTTNKQESMTMKATQYLNYSIYSIYEPNLYSESNILEYLKSTMLERNRVKADKAPNRNTSPFARTQNQDGKAGEKVFKGDYKNIYKNKYPSKNIFTNIGVRLAAFVFLILVPLWKCAMKANEGRFLLYMCLIVLAIILVLFLEIKSWEKARQIEEKTRRIEEETRRIEEKRRQWEEILKTTNNETSGMEMMKLIDEVLKSNQLIDYKIDAGSMNKEIGEEVDKGTTKETSSKRERQ